MIRLETVEDFEKARKALDNPDSKLSEYCMYDYGYCSFCKSLSVCFAKKEPCHIHCNGCGNDFYLDYNGLSYLYMISAGSSDYPEPGQVFEFKLGDDIPEQQRVGAAAFSRKNQRKLFNFALESRIVALKREQRALARKIRRLAKLK